MGDTVILDPSTADLARRLQDALALRDGRPLDDDTAIAVARDLEGVWPNPVEV